MMQQSHPIKAGPWGGNGGDPFDLGEKPGRLGGIRIGHGAIIDSIQFLYEDQWTRRFGGPGGEITEEGEYLKDILGYQGPFDNLFLITSLTFVTNKGKYGPFGTEQGYNFSVINGRIVSFFGRSGTYLDALGVYAVTGLQV